MRQKLIFGILIGIILVSGCTTQSEYTTKIFNNDGSKPTSPMDLQLNVTTLPNREMEITVRVSKAQFVSNFNAPNVTMKIILPSQLQLIEGKPGWYGDIYGDQVVERRIRVKAINNGEGTVEAYAVTAPIGEYEYYFGDTEKFYVYVTDNKIRISETPFTKWGGPRSQIEAV